ncbi:MAG: diacylglycerol kinase family lipid kinase [Lachnospiraceae bacterium]|nr:diacylglycerol kinase family lipid kinase [Lachnospiraceae bacterium]
MSAYKRLLFIVNPHAGVKKKDSALSDIILTFSDHYYETIVCFTREPGDAETLIREHAGEEFDRIVCMGGDGTLSEVIGGCRKYAMNIPMGYIPAGSTNDFAQSLQLPMEPAEAAERIMKGKPHKLDVGMWEERQFVYTASCGLFTRASYDTPQKVKNVLGHAAYVLEGMRELTQVRSYHMQITAGERTFEDNYLFVTICNTISLGGVMDLSRAEVNFSDGLFELLLIPMPRDLIQLTQIVNALREQRFDTPLVTFIKTERVVIKCPEKPDWSLDGEKAEGKETVEIRVVPGGISMFY